MNNLSFYFARFTFLAIKSLLRQQNLLLPTAAISDQVNFVLTKENHQQWHRLFSVQSREIAIPFDYYWPYFGLFFFRVLAELNLNYRNILHLGHDVYFPNGCAGIGVNASVQIQISVEDIALLDRNRAVVRIESLITRSEEDFIVCRCVDTLFVKNLRQASIEQLKNSSRYNKTNVQPFLNLSKRTATLTNQKVQVAHFSISEHFGLRYGKVSGDLNPIHIQLTLARLFGYSRAFVQGSAICNFISKLFIGDQQEHLQFLSVKFCCPVHLGQTIRVNFTDKRFELIDEEGKLVVIGERAT